jgi:hypothetical protein
MITVSVCYRFKGFKGDKGQVSNCAGVKYQDAKVLNFSSVQGENR